MKRVTAATTSAALLEFDSDPTPFHDGMLFRSEVSITLHVSRLDGNESSDVIAAMVASELAPGRSRSKDPSSARVTPGVGLLLYPGPGAR